MNSSSLFILLFCIIASIAIIFRKTAVPTSLLLVIAGMFISYIPDFPHIGINPDLVLNVFLPLLIYETSAYTSWVDVRKNLRSITALSIGHVIFITLLVASTIHTLIPQLGWPLAFVLGAVIAPPDDVAILSIAKKTHMPRKILTVLIGESMFNDATALILFRFSLAALATHEFFPLQAISTFFMLVIGQTIYGLLVGHVTGQLRLRLNDPVLQVIVSLLTPFLAYLPANYVCGSGVIATVVTGLLIGHSYTERFPPDVRLTSHEVWTTLSFLVQSMIFLLVGLDMRFILARISSIPIHNIILYCSVTIFVVILGRFIWVYAATYLPRLLIPSSKKKAPSPSWQNSFIISWAGMRGGISLAAAVAIPNLPFSLNGSSPRDLIIFLVFSVIAATLLLQGLTFPWILKMSGIRMSGENEKNHEYSTELSARLSIAETILSWLADYKALNFNNLQLHEEIDLHIQEYKTLAKQFTNQLKNNSMLGKNNPSSKLDNSLLLTAKIIEMERSEVLQLWLEGKISHAIKNKLIQQLDLRAKHVARYVL